MNTRKMLLVWQFSEYAQENVNIFTINDDEYTRDMYKEKILMEVTVVIPTREAIVRDGVDKYNKELAENYIEKGKIEHKLQNLLALTAIKPDIDVMVADIIMDTRQDVYIDDDYPF